MILAIDIGNTTVTLGGVRTGPHRSKRIPSNSQPGLTSTTPGLPASMNLRSSSFLKTRIFPRPTFGASSFPALFRRF